MYVMVEPKLKNIGSSKFTAYDKFGNKTATGCQVMGQLKNIGL